MTKNLIAALKNTAREVAAFEEQLSTDFQGFPSNGKCHQRVIRERMGDQPEPDPLLVEKRALALFIINQDSKVVQKHVGLFNPPLYEIEARALLSMPVPARVETFEDTGEVFLKHADRATMLPGVDASKLTPEQRMAALHKLNAEPCDCGCKYTLAQCRIYDPGCNISKERAAAIVKEAAKLPAKDTPGNAAAPASSAR
jgi:hypothetical protein